MSIFKKQISNEEQAKNIGVILGENVDIGNDVFWGSEPYLIKIGDNTTIAGKTTFITHDGGVRIMRKLRNDYSFDLVKPIIIGNNSFIGMNSTILYGVKIGNNVLVGACSLVNKDLEDNFVYAGVPAKKICSIEEFYKKHEAELLPTKQLDPEAKKEFLLKKFGKDLNL